MWSLLLGSLLLQPAPEPPAASATGRPPLIVKAGVDKDRLVSTETVTSIRFVPVTVQRTIGGKVVTTTQTVPQTVASTVKRVWDLKKAKITHGNGKKMDLDTLGKRLAVEAPVVVSADGKPISKGYLNLLRADVIVIEAPIVPDPAPIPPK